MARSARGRSTGCGAAKVAVDDRPGTSTTLAKPQLGTLRHLRRPVSSLEAVPAADRRRSPENVPTDRGGAAALHRAGARRCASTEPQPATKARDGFGDSSHVVPALAAATAKVAAAVELPALSARTERQERDFEQIGGSSSSTGQAESTRCAVAAMPLVESAPTFAWVAAAAQLRDSGAETRGSIEELLRDLAAASTALHKDLEAQQQHLSSLVQESATAERNLSLIDENISNVRQARLEAVKKVEGLTRTCAHEVKAIKNRPPRMVRRAVEAVYTVLHCPRWKADGREGLRGLDVAKEWTRIQKMLSNNDFVQSVLQFDVANLDSAPHVAEYTAERYFPMLPRDSAGVQEQLPLLMDMPMVAPAAANGPGLAQQSEAAAGNSTGLARCRASRELHAGSLVAISEASPRRGTSQRNAGAASLAAAKLLKNTHARKSTTEAAAEPLDVLAVEYASRPAAILVLWLQEVLNEFFAMRELRRLREALCASLEVITAKRLRMEEACAKINTELIQVASEVKCWNTRLEEMRAREVEAELARLRLAQLGQLEERFAGGRPSPSFSRSGRGGRFKAADRDPPVDPLETAWNFDDSPLTLSNRISGGGPTPSFVQNRMAASMVELQASSTSTLVSKQAAARSDLRASTTGKGHQPVGLASCWPPRGRKYLHVMSTPVLTGEEAERSATPMSPADLRSPS